MSLNNYSTDQTVIVINGREIQDFGDTDPPISEAPIDPRGVLRRGLGGNAVRLDRINPGRTVTINLNPGSPDAEYMQGLFNSRANITYTRTIIGSLENVVASEGMIVNDGTVGRGGVTITDKQYIMEFNKYVEL